MILLAQRLRGRVVQSLTIVLVTGGLLIACASSITPDEAASSSIESTIAAPQPDDADAPSASTTESAHARTATVVMSGDLLWHSGLWEEAAHVGAETGRLP